MSEITVARIKRELTKVDKLNNELYGSLGDGSITPLHLWLEIRKHACRHEGIGVTDIQALIRPPVSAARALYLIELIRNNLNKRLHGHLFAFLDHDYGLVRDSACFVLGRTNDLDVKAELEARLATADPRFRENLIEVLANFSSEEVPDYVFEKFGAPDAHSRRIAVDALGLIRSGRANELLLEALRDKDKWVANAAEQKLEDPLRNNSLVRNRLKEMCVGRDTKAKLRAVRLLGLHQNAEATDLLVSMYERASKPLRQQILFALGRIATREATNHIIRLMQGERDEKSAAYGCMALSKCPYPEAVDKLMDLYRKREFGDGGRDGGVLYSNLYVLAAECVKRNESAEGTKYMIELLDADSPRIREEMAKGLGTRKAVQALGKMEMILAHEEDEDVKGALERACKKLRKLVIN